MDDVRAKELLIRIARRDEAAFETIYRAFSRRVFSYALYMLKEPSRAEEVLVDTMHEVWCNAARFRGESRFSTWLIGIARNKSLLVHRGRRADEVHDDLEDVAETQIDELAPEGFAELAAKQRRQGVQACMGRLSQEHRECLQLVFYEGCSLAEVAQLQGVPENTVKTRLYHARQRIKNCLRRLIEREGADSGASA
jgi:RNA polymerase sigma-70 factor (ECF subfamily)